MNGERVYSVTSDLNVTAFVTSTAKGFAVQVRDEDEGITLPTIVFYPDLSQAVAFADKCVR